AIEIHCSGRSVEVLCFRAVAVTVEELHGDECVKEIADATRMKAQFGTEFCAGELAVADFGEHAGIDGGEENRGRTEGERRLEDWRGVELRAGTMHKLVLPIPLQRSDTNDASVKAGFSP